MNERLKEFFDFKNHTLKALATIFVLIVLNIVFWISVGTRFPLRLTDALILSFAIFFFIYIFTLYRVNRAKGENINLAILKNNLISLKSFGLLYLVVFPIIATFYYLTKSILDSINPQSQTVQIVIFISAALFGLGIVLLLLYLLEYLVTKNVQKEVESKEGKKNEFVYFREGTPEETKLQIYDLEPKAGMLPKEEQNKLMRNLKRKVKK